MDFYDIHGFMIAVEGPAGAIFLKEYAWAKVLSNKVKVNFYVKPFQQRDNVSTKPAGSREGMYIPFREDQNTLWYDYGVPVNVLLNFCEGLMWWPDKTILHAGAVAKRGKAFVFSGSGNVGKTSIVLNLLKEGYDYISDDWMVIRAGEAYSLPKPIHIFDYNLKNNDIARAVLGHRRFLYKPYFRMIEFAREHAPHRYIRYALEVYKPVFYVELGKLSPGSKVAPPMKIDTIHFLERKDTASIQIKDDISSEDLAMRMAYVNLYEWNFIFREYYKYSYMYGIRNERFENRYAHDFSIMFDAFSKAKLRRVVIPRKLDLTKVQLTELLNLG